jgi:UDP-N-acetylglucosamine--N-acetylmuramyl-(pentapeptide) pyrophosphoryl-undecaprenol N-acetylglucosamine transferase
MSETLPFDGGQSMKKFATVPTVPIHGSAGHFIIPCGGTGGHLTPGIAVGQELHRRGHRVTLFMSGKAIDLRLSKNYPQFRFISLPGSGFSLNPLRLVKFVGNLLRSFFRCRAFMGENPTDGVIAFGGFSCVGTALAAYSRRIPIFLHEANLHRGKAIWLLTPLATRVYVPSLLKESKKFSQRPNHVAMGYPIREDFCPVSQAKARATLNLPDFGKCLVISGGSQGAKSLIQWTKSNAPALANLGYHTICLGGLGGEEGELQLQGKDGRIYFIRFHGFSDSMHLIYSAADLVVGRAGAGTIGELIHCEKPSILIPYPIATGDHQSKNAKGLGDRAMARVLPQKQLEDLLPTIAALREEDLLHMANGLHLEKQRIGNAAIALVDDVLLHFSKKTPPGGGDLELNGKT